MNGTTKEKRRERKNWDGIEVEIETESARGIVCDRNGVDGLCFDFRQFADAEAREVTTAVSFSNILPEYCITQLQFFFHKVTFTLKVRISQQNKKADLGTRWSHFQTEVFVPSCAMCQRIDRIFAILNIVRCLGSHSA